jgi:hypothetical protein
MNTRLHLSQVMMVFMLFAASAAHAGTQPAGDPASSPLSGPRVADETVRTLVSRDMQGRFQPVEGRPEAAALARIPIDPVRREAARRVLEDRASALRAHLVEHIDMLRAWTDASLAGEEEEVRRIQIELYQMFEPEGDRGVLHAPLTEVLSPAEFVELERVLDEYWDAWMAAEAGDRMMDGAVPENLEQRLAYRLYQQELGYAYESTLRPVQQRLERIYAAVEPTPDQREAIRAAVIGLIRAGGLSPTEAQRDEAARAIYDALDEDRRFRLFAAGLSAM